MDNQEKQGKTLVEIARVELDFDEISKWRKTAADDLPVCSLLSLYEACGMSQIIRDYLEDHPEGQITGLDSLTCNFYTMQRMKNFIMDVWSRYSLSITEDNKVKWDTHRYAKGVAHKPREPKAKIRNSINFDFVNFCPSVDDDLPDNVLVFSMPKPTPPEDEVVVLTDEE
ncbi:MAG: hypothetical protein J6S67_23445 [Methanobrevibacter sp.]|nr:hypothetical protein [Methanobrevibacter sp.]